ncbi:MAG TPA: hypothetical protein VN366_06710 [Feifaniaceae bacterium]|nr:hypothetical protein [Feifaniaceae bacterium]
MLAFDKLARRFTMQNDALRLAVDFSNGAVIRELTNLHGGAANRDREAFVLRIYGKDLTSRDFALTDALSFEDATEELVTLLFENEAEKLKVRLHFLNDRRASIRIIAQVWDGYKLGVPHESRFRLPILNELECGENSTLLPPGCPFRSRSGKKIIMPLRDYQYSSDIRLPMVVLGADGKTGFSVTFPSLSDLNNEGSSQLVNKFFSVMETEQEIRNSFVRICPDASFSDTVELLIMGITRGWPEAFTRYRDFWAKPYCFAEYEKTDLKWFNDCAVHNFVFFFGKEGFDHQKMEIDVEGLLEQGEAFGGYDTVTIWNQYPRLGIDKRTQWNFYDDFPGGRAALREAVEKFHAHGVAVFLPYIPWDQGPRECEGSMGDEFARITAETDADGWQLDTMYSIPVSFREKLNKVRPGLVLTSQFHPTKKLPVELLTTSWDEYWRCEAMPEVDVLRFLLPIHLAPQISRWARYEDKTRLINRAMFGGAPIVIWQDIFGRWMPFADDQKAMIKAWKAVYLKYRDIFQKGKPIPLYPTTGENLCCNVFTDDGETASIYSFYNDCPEAVEGDCELWHPFQTRAELILGEGADASLKQGRLFVRVPPYSVAQVLVR